MLTAKPYNFSVDFDYSYKRYDSNLEKEFSVDIKAGGYYPFSINSKIKIKLDLLIECKYRNPNVSWLFIQDINPEPFSNFSSKGAIKVVDEFSEIYSKDSFCGFPICETCLKGIEVNTQNGEVHDTGITHGVSQLVYSMPQLLKSHISNSLSDHLADVTPYIMCPILVTTADLRILRNQFSIEELGKADSLDDISYEVPFIRLYSDVYPSFLEHCKAIFQNTPDSSQLGQYGYFCGLRKPPLDKDGLPNPKKLYSRPDWLLNALANGYEEDFFRETIICNLKNFRALLKEIKAGIQCIGRGFQKIATASLT